MSVGIAGLGYALPARSLSVRELHERGLLSSEPALLEAFGFDRVHVAERETPYELAVQAVRRALASADIDPAQVGLLVWGGGQGATAFTNAPTAAACAAAQRTTARFRSPAARLQHEVGLTRAMVLGVDQLACTSLLGAVRVARALCLTEGVDHALCVSAEFYPADAGREAIWNCTSDAAVAVLLARGAGAHRIVGATQVTKGYYWDAAARRDEMIAAYFPTACHVLRQTVESAGWRAEDVDWVVPHNVSRRSWDVLLPLAALPGARLWGDNIGRIGHTLAGDNFINLADATARGDIVAGERVILFSYGYGAHWTALALEV